MSTIKIIWVGDEAYVISHICAVGTVRWNDDEQGHFGFYVAINGGVKWFGYENEAVAIEARHNLLFQLS